jgi:uncharacterized protein YkwD
MQQRPSDESVQPDPERSVRQRIRSFRLSPIWLLPALPLLAALVLVSWPLPSSATGASPASSAPPPPGMASGEPLQVLLRVFPRPFSPTTTIGVTSDVGWISGNVALTDGLLEGYHPPTLVTAPDVTPPEDGQPEAQPVPPAAAGPTPASTATPTITPTVTPTVVPTPVPTPIATPVPTVVPPQPVSNLVLSPREALLLAAMNEARVAAGLSALVPRADLTEVARARSEEMTRLGYFAHYHPDGTSAYQLMAEAGITFSAAGENLVKTFGDVEHSVEIGFQALMNSSTHRDNILKAVYARVGVGSFTSDDGVTIITVVFTDR